MKNKKQTNKTNKHKTKQTQIKKASITKVLRSIYANYYSQESRLPVNTVNQENLKDLTLTKDMSRLQTREDRLRRRQALLVLVLFFCFVLFFVFCFLFVVFCFLFFLFCLFHVLKKPKKNQKNKQQTNQTKPNKGGSTRQRRRGQEAASRQRYCPSP